MVPNGWNPNSDQPSRLAVKRPGEFFASPDLAVTNIVTMQTNVVNSMDNVVSPVEIPPAAGQVKTRRLSGKRAAVVVLCSYPRIRRSAEALVDEGMSVDLICTKQKKEDPTRESINGVQVLRVPLQHSRGGKAWYFFHYFSFLATSLFLLGFRSLTRRYDLVIVHNMPDILVFSALIPRLLGAKVVLDLQDPMPELMQTIFGVSEESRSVRLLKFLEKLSISFAHGVITVSETFRKTFSSRSCAAEKVSVVMNSPDEKVFALRPPAVARSLNETRPFVVMYHGTLVERHGLGVAVEAVSRVRQVLPNVELKVYGDRTPYLDQVLAEARKQGRQHWVHYLGSKTQRQIVQAIDECDLGIVPNCSNIFTRINMPTRIFEFLTRGKPVIGPCTPGVREYFAEDALVFFELGDAADLARQIEFVVRHPLEIGEITRRGQEVCLAHPWSHERETLVGMTLKLLTENGVAKHFAARCPEAQVE
jgi:glycosyltransferase involved in cell wall biosynthesis